VAVAVVVGGWDGDGMGMGWAVGGASQHIGTHCRRGKDTGARTGGKHITFREVPKAGNRRSSHCAEADVGRSREADGMWGRTVLAVGLPLVGELFEEIRRVYHVGEGEPAPRRGGNLENRK